MTYADEEFMTAEGQEETPNYPTAFGITFTPTIGGIIIGVIGLGLAGYLAVTQVQPAWQKYQELKNTVQEKESQVQQQEEIKKKIKETEAKLAQAKLQNKQVLNLFASEKALDTLALDLNTFVKSRNGSLISFEPVQEEAGAQSGTPEASSATLGNGKLKIKSYKVKLEGSFDQVQSIMRSFERLQSLLIPKDFKAEVSDDQGVVINPQTGKSVPAIFKKENNKAIPGGKPTITTTFRLDALVPVTDEAANKAAPAAANPAPQ